MHAQSVLDAGLMLAEKWKTLKFNGSALNNIDEKQKKIV